ncbi:MAG: EAL domain-containing protein [Rhizobiales bacterium]|nr:EAL domain-containing protein [Hyphomicrobiales bacterium]
MQREDWPAIIGTAMFALLAMGSALFMLAAGEVEATVIAGALLLLAAGQVVALFVQGMRNTDLDERLSDQGRKLRATSKEIASIVDRIAWMQQQIAQPIGRPIEDLMEEVRKLRGHVETLARDIANSPKPASETRHDAAPEPATQPKEAATGDRLDFLLEPVVELSTGATAHYRARVNMVGIEGAEVSHEEMMRKADAGGVRAALDIHIVKLALPVLRRLRNKHPAMCLLIPLGVATLKTEQDVTRLMRVMEDDTETARGIVFDIAHSDLAGLDAGGIEGLARLGRLGIKMALSQVSIAGLDLASLRQLGVRFLDIDAAGLNTRLETAPAWVEFAQFARAMQFRIIGGGIVSADQAETASHIARFGYGPYFAPPRRVRADAGQAAGASRTQAA